MKARCEPTVLGHMNEVYTKEISDYDDQEQETDQWIQTARGCLTCTGTTLPVQESRQIIGHKWQQIHLSHKLRACWRYTTSLEHRAQQKRVLEDPISGGWVEDNRNQWQKSHDSKGGMKPGGKDKGQGFPRSLDPSGPPLKEAYLGGVLCGLEPFHMSSLLRSVNGTLNFSKLVQVGKEEGPIVQVSWAHILSGV